MPQDIMVPFIEFDLPPLVPCMRQHKNMMCLKIVICHSHVPSRSSMLEHLRKASRSPK